MYLVLLSTVQCVCFHYCRYELRLSLGAVPGNKLIPTICNERVSAGSLYSLLADQKHIDWSWQPEVKVEFITTSFGINEWQFVLVSMNGYVRASSFKNFPWQSTCVNREIEIVNNNTD